MPLRLKTQNGNPVYDPTSWALAAEGPNFKIYWTDGEAAFFDFPYITKRKKLVGHYQRIRDKFYANQMAKSQRDGPQATRSQSEEAHSEASSRKEDTLPTPLEM